VRQPQPAHTLSFPTDTLAETEEKMVIVEVSHWLKGWRERRRLRREARRLIRFYRDYLRLLRQVQQEAEELGLARHD
jgi:hypothetical protein